MKKVKFTFWLLGFGCGMILTGMLGTLLTLKVDFEVVSSQDDQIHNTMQPLTKENKEIENLSLEESDTVSEDEPIKEDNLIEDLVGEKENTLKLEESTIETQEKYEVYIPDQSGASEICRILEQAGIIENGKDFLEYIKENEKQTKLKNGYLELPYNADYATLLELLVV